MENTIECGYKNWDNLSSLKVIKNSQGYVWKAIAKKDLEDGYRMKIRRGKVVKIWVRISDSLIKA